MIKPKNQSGAMKLVKTQKTKQFDQKGTINLLKESLEMSKQKLKMISFFQYKHKITKAKFGLITKNHTYNCSNKPTTPAFENCKMEWYNCEYYEKKPNVKYEIYKTQKEVKNWLETQNNKVTEKES